MNSSFSSDFPKKNSEWDGNSWVDPVHSYSCDKRMSKSAGMKKYRQQLEESLVLSRYCSISTKESAEAVSPDKSLGRLTRMEAMQDQQLMLEARRRKKMQKVAVQSALQRIENGQFGSCIFCRNLIPEERLDVAPESSSCVNCSAFS